MAWIGFAVIAALTCIVIMQGFRLRRLKQSRQEQADLSEAGILASGLAHEIRNPLNSIKINMQLMQEDLEDLVQKPDDRETLNETFRLIDYEINRLNGLMTNFLTYARPIDLKTEEMELVSFLNELILFLNPQAAEQGVSISLTTPEDAVPIPGDPTKLRQALLNILLNDIQILQQDGQIQVELKQLRDLAVIHISDNGPGMTPELMREIFVAFQSQRKGGTGLGLSIAQRFVEAHGGGIKVDSTPGEGTTFSVILPLQSS